jgi:hypothetical protein
MTGVAPATLRSKASNPCLQKCLAKLGRILRNPNILSEIELVRLEQCCGCIVASTMLSILEKRTYWNVCFQRTPAHHEQLGEKSLPKVPIEKEKGARLFA